MSHDYFFFGYDTLTCIHIDGPARWAWRDWGLYDHCGPLLHLRYLGYPEDKYCWLPKDLLCLLYERFSAANPTGTKILMNEGMFEYVGHKYGQKKLDEMCENYTVLISIDNQDCEQGYPHLMPYLPELRDSGVIARLASDPWLDWTLCSMAQKAGVDNGGIPDNLYVSRDARWSIDWRKFCDDPNRIASIKNRNISAVKIAHTKRFDELPPSPDYEPWIKPWWKFW